MGPMDTNAGDSRVVHGDSNRPDDNGGGGGFLAQSGGQNDPEPCLSLEWHVQYDGANPDGSAYGTKPDQRQSITISGDGQWWGRVGNGCSVECGNYICAWVSSFLDRVH